MRTVIRTVCLFNVQLSTWSATLTPVQASNCMSHRYINSPSEAGLINIDKTITRLWRPLTRPALPALTVLRQARLLKSLYQSLMSLSEVRLIQSTVQQAFCFRPSVSAHFQYLSEWRRSKFTYKLIIVNHLHCAW